MKLSSRGGFLTLLSALIAGYLAGSARLQTASHRSIVTMDQAEIVATHPAALYVRTGIGEEKHFLIDPLDREWASTFAAYAGKRWHLELEPSSCPNRYNVRTGLSD